MKNDNMLKILIIDCCRKCCYCNNAFIGGYLCSKLDQEIDNYPDIPDWCPLETFKLKNEAG